MDRAEENRPGRSAFSAAATWLIVLSAGAIPAILLNTAVDYPLERDRFYHLAVAEDYLRGEFALEPRIREGVFAHHPADLSFLFHLALAALLALGVPALATPVALSAAAGAVLSAVIFRHSRSPLIACCAMLSCGTFLFRMHMGRPHVWGVALATLGVALLLDRRFRFAAYVQLLYSSTYSVPVVLPLAALVQSAFARDRGPVLWIGGAALLGLLLHPHFPDNLVLLWYQGAEVVGNALLGNPHRLRLRGEIQPRDLVHLAHDAWLALAVFALGLFRRKVPRAVLVMQAIFLLLLLRMNRMIEYWMPLVFLTARPVFDLVLPSRPHIVRAVLVLLLLAVTTGPSFRGALRAVHGGGGPVFRDSALWLREHAAGEYVFNAEWDSYPQLRYFGGNFDLAQGQDPVFVAAYDPERFEAMRSAAEGKLTVEEFAARFPCRHVVARAASPIVRWMTHPNVRVAFTSGDVVVLELVESGSPSVPKAVERVPAAAGVKRSP